MRAASGSQAVAGGFFLPPLRGAQPGVHEGEARLRVPRLRLSRFGDGRNDFSQDEDSAAALVLGHLPNEPREERGLGAAIE